MSWKVEKTGDREALRATDPQRVAGDGGSHLEAGPERRHRSREEELYIRQNHTMSDYVMNTTKTAIELELSIPDELVDVLKEHITMIDASPIAAKTDLLFALAVHGEDAVDRMPCEAVAGDCQRWD